MNRITADRRMTRRLVIPLVAAVLALTALSACAPSHPSKGMNTMESSAGSLTPEQAKAESLRMQDELVALVPAAWIAERRTEQTAHLRSCAADGLYSWSGFTGLTLNGEHDTDELVTAVASAYAKSSLTVTIDKNPKGLRRVSLTAEDGANYLVAPGPKDQTGMSIYAGSPCFRLPDGMSALDKF